MDPQQKGIIQSELFRNFIRAGNDASIAMSDPVGSRSRAVLPDEPMKAFRGENLIKSLGSPLGPAEDVGQFYGFTPEKAARYPDRMDRAPGIFGGTITRSMDVTPSEIIEGNRKALHTHAKRIFNRNLENGVEKAVAENLYFQDLNKADDYITSVKAQLDKGLLSKDRLDFMLKGIMDEGMFPDRQGDIDIKETYKRGNVGMAALVGAGRAAPKIAFGLAGIPVDAILGATETGLDPEEQVAQAYGISPSLLYKMEPEKFEAVYQKFESDVAKMQEQRSTAAAEAAGDAPSLAVSLKAS
jgi:hypothetical protein